MTPTPKHLTILRHSLGLDDRGHGAQYRNHYCAGSGHHSYNECSQLVADGLMIVYPPSQLTGGDHIFMVTDQGKAVVSETREPELKLTRGQRRYRAWLEADCGMRFGEWLKQVSA